MALNELSTTSSLPWENRASLGSLSGVTLLVRRSAIQTGDDTRNFASGSSYIIWFCLALRAFFLAASSLRLRFTLGFS
jgi:hypothetical protein